MDVENSAYSLLFIKTASKLFEFLVSEFRFAGPILEVRRGGLLRVIYKGRHLAIELLLDEREKDVDCKISLVRQGALTTEYATDASGRRVRVDLISLLLERGHRSPILRSAEGLELEHYIPMALEDYAKLLRQCGQDILAHSESALEVPKIQ